MSTDARLRGEAVCILSLFLYVNWGWEKLRKCRHPFSFSFIPSCPRYSTFHVLFTSSFWTPPTELTDTFFVCNESISYRAHAFKCTLFVVVAFCWFQYLPVSRFLFIENDSRHYDNEKCFFSRNVFKLFLEKLIYKIIILSWNFFMYLMKHNSLINSQSSAVLKDKSLWQRIIENEVVLLFKLGTEKINWCKRNWYNAITNTW